MDIALLAFLIVLFIIGACFFNIVVACSTLPGMDCSSVMIRAVSPDPVIVAQMHATILGLNPDGITTLPFFFETVCKKSGAKCPGREKCQENQE